MQSNHTLRHAARRTSAGFSLIELMVVIVIIGILGTGAIIVFSGATDDAKNARAGSEIKMMADNVSTYYIKNNSQLPTDLPSLFSSMKLGTVPNDPWERPYEYAPGEGNKFMLKSHGISTGVETDDVYWDADAQRVVIPRNDGNTNQ